ncbi:MAG TPA: hypothetical protein VES62_09910 [Thermoleophilaceae bacterium]|nr:hypothetical protein [Actinomycetota bacterium]HYN51227.1 hypothetical protein [Thermoleophilaceae bacterium]
MSKGRGGRALARAVAAIRGRRVVSLDDARVRAKRHCKRSKEVPFFHRLY